MSTRECQEKRLTVKHRNSSQIGFKIKFQTLQPPDQLTVPGNLAKETVVSFNAFHSRENI